MPKLNSLYGLYAHDYFDEAAHRFLCEKCKAKKGQRCSTKNGARSTPHTARLTLWRKWNKARNNDGR